MIGSDRFNSGLSSMMNNLTTFIEYIEGTGLEVVSPRGAC